MEADTEVAAEVEVEAAVEGEVAAACEHSLTIFLDDELLVISNHVEEGEVVLVGRPAKRNAEMKAPLLLLLLLLLMPHPPVVYRPAAAQSRVRAGLVVVRWTCVSGGW